MNGKSKGTGLLNDKGKIVKEIKAKIAEAEKKMLNTALQISLTGNIGALGDITNYQNDGMGCPTSDIKKPKAKKLKRVK